MKKTLLVVANNNIGPGQSGGDTIFLNFVKYWQKKLNIIVFGSQESKNLLKKFNLYPKFIKSDSVNHHYSLSVISLIYHHLRRIIKGLDTFISHSSVFKNADYCYTASDFLPDFIFGLLYKLIKPNGLWLCSYYLLADKITYKNQPFKGLFYYLTQKITLFLSNKYADVILITSLPDKKFFPKKKVIIVRGGVDTTISKKFSKIPLSKRKYDAVFQGRLHPQKGVLEMIDIWNLVVSKLPSAKLAIIGDGQLKQQLLDKIKNLNLQKNILYFGFQNSSKKYQIISHSKIVLHPAIFDSGGMSAAEAMAFALPGVSYDLPALKTYYPQGMIKTPIGNKKQFALNILKLLNSQSLYKKYSQQALDLINNDWDWKKHAQYLYKQIFK